MSRALKISYFAAYLYDRIIYASRLGLLKKLPRRDEALLDIGNEITLADIQKLLDEKQKKAKEQSKQKEHTQVIWLYKDTINRHGERVRLVNPDLPQEEREQYEETAKEEGIRVIDLEEAPKERRAILQASQAEKYPTIRWNFPWNPYTIVGAPDGITKKFVYEYKTTRSLFLFRFRKPVAFAQADLYGYFFQRPQKRVQIQIIEENKTETYEELIDVTRVEETLASFAQVDAGKPARPPRAWKCRICDFRSTCPITPDK